MTQIEKDEMIREALKGAGEILKLAYEACGLKVGITGELAYPNGKFLLRFYPFDESFSNSENKTTLGQASSEPIADNKQLGNGTQAVVTDEASEKPVSDPLGKRTEDGNICPHCNGTGEYFGGHYGMKLMKCRNCHGKGHL